MASSESSASSAGSRASRPLGAKKNRRTHESRLRLTRLTCTPSSPLMLSLKRNGRCRPISQVWLESLRRSEEHTYELQSLMRISYAVFCLKKKNTEQYKQSTRRICD